MRNLGILFCATLIGTSAVTFAAEPEAIFFAPHSGQNGVPVSSLNIPKIDFSKLRQSSDKLASTGPTFTIVYQDVLSDTNAGFDDPTLGAARRAVVTEVTNYLKTVIFDQGNCDIYFQTSLNANNGFLGFAGTSFFTSSTFQPGFAFSHITTGVDPSGSNPDISAQINFFYPFNLNTSAATTGGNYDLHSVLLHEFTHGLGILSGISQSGASQISSGIYSKFDEQVTANNGVRVISNLGVYSGASVVAGDNTIQFRGAGTNTVLGFFPPLYTPGAFVAASSMSHWQLNSPIPVQAVMRPSLTPNTDNRAYQPFEIKALGDLGYAITAPSSTKAWDVYTY